MKDKQTDPKQLMDNCGLIEEAEGVLLFLKADVQEGEAEYFEGLLVAAIDKRGDAFVKDALAAALKTAADERGEASSSAVASFEGWPLEKQKEIRNAARDVMLSSEGVGDCRESDGYNLASTILGQPLAVCCSDCDDHYSEGELDENYLCPLCRMDNDDEGDE
jgi:hypothetical protein